VNEFSSLETSNGGGRQENKYTDVPLTSQNNSSTLQVQNTAVLLEC